MRKAARLDGVGPLHHIAGMQQRPTPAEIRRLSVELGVGSSHRSRGLIYGLAGVAVLALISAPFAIPARPLETVYGVVVADAFEGKGSRPAVVARIDGKSVMISIPRRNLCRPGDRIQLNKRKGLIGPPRYSVGYGLCDKP